MSEQGTSLKLGLWVYTMTDIGGVEIDFTYSVRIYQHLFTKMQAVFHSRQGMKNSRHRHKINPPTNHVNDWADFYFILSRVHIIELKCNKMHKRTTYNQDVESFGFIDSYMKT
jgi:hypothetical protein